MDEARVQNDFDPLDRLADEFVSSRREGKEPSVEMYAVQHPDLAEGIRSLFPVLNLLERNKPARSAPKMAEIGREPEAAGPCPAGWETIC